jgi:hypothetical protein
LEGGTSPQRKRRLQFVELYKFSAVDELVRGIDLDVQVGGKTPDGHVRVRL